MHQTINEIQHHLRGLQKRTREIERALIQMANVLDQLLLDVADENTVIDSAITLLDNLSAAMKGAGTDPTKLAALQASLASGKSKLAAAIVANTPGSPVNPGLPVVNSTSPTSGKVGDTVTISGSGFGATQGASTISFNGVDAGQASFYSENSIKVLVPFGAQSGPIQVSTSGGKSALGFDFSVTA